MKDLQIQQQEAEHKILKENLTALQDTLEKFHDEQFDIKKTELAPTASNPMFDKFKEAIDQMVVEKEKETETEKGTLPFLIPWDHLSLTKLSPICRESAEGLRGEDQKN